MIAIYISARILTFTGDFTRMNASLKTIQVSFPHVTRPDDSTGWIESLLLETQSVTLLKRLPETTLASNCTLCA